MDGDGQWLEERADLEAQLGGKAMYPAGGMVHELLQGALVMGKLGARAAEAQGWADVVSPIAAVVALSAGYAALERDDVACLQVWIRLGDTGAYGDDFTCCLVAQAEWLADLDAPIAEVGVIVYVRAADGGGASCDSDLVAGERREVC